MAKYFTFKLRDGAIRGMTREQYYSASHYVRYLSWKMDGMINREVFRRHITDSLLFGYSEISVGDLMT